jgi:hypothetical protein
VRVFSFQHQMLQRGCIGYPIHFEADQGGNVAADLMKIVEEHLLGDFPDDGQFFMIFYFFGERRGVVDQPAAKGLELDGLVGAVSDHTDEFAGREGGDAGMNCSSCPDWVMLVVDGVDIGGNERANVCRTSLCSDQANATTQHKGRPRVAARRPLSSAFPVSTASPVATVAPRSDQRSNHIAN